ncbi:hypothetical protein [Neorhizobium galegae]|uniref:hypothetical protein n=1 Tax=Neorhizobium galegae TaxID=399 RepID=UPI0021055734|nr:hypothetical protein [Neorhizobium galegae]MCQ1853385.1 hypothetical protein [Neorhizobium galegae]
MPEINNSKIFPFDIQDHPQLQRYINITTIASIIIVTSATYLLGYFLSIGVFKDLLFATLNLSKSFQDRFQDLNKYDNFSGYYYISGALIYIISSIIVFSSAIFVYFKKQTVNIVGKYENGMIIGVLILYLIAFLLTYTLLFHHVGISEERYVGTSRFFTAYFFPFLLGMSTFFSQACAFSTAALFHRLNKG